MLFIKHFYNKKTYKYKKLYIYIIWTFIIFILIIITNYFYIEKVYNAKNFNYENINLLPHNKVGLLLGTSPKTKDGMNNIFFTERIIAAKYLLDNKKIDYIIVSGDNKTEDYNEPRSMRQSLENIGVDPHIIIEDYAGKRTLDSIIRSKKIFGQSSFTIISQDFHNRRAIFIAEKNNINSVAFAADIYKKDFITKWRMIIREILARVQASIDIITKQDAELLGQKIQIPD